MIGSDALEIEERTQRHVAVLTIRGRIDSKTSQEFEQRLRDTIRDTSPCLLLDMAGVEYITSAGMRALASAYKAISKLNRGDIAIANLRHDLADLFHLIGFDGLFTLYPSVETALAQMSACVAQDSTDTPS